MINGRHSVIFLLGSNMGERDEKISSCREVIERELGKIRKASRVYETEPWGREDQPWYLNQAIEIATEDSLESLFRKLEGIERELGRDRSKEVKWGPRPIDIDVLYYDDIIKNEEKTKIPHPHIPERKFVLVPLCEIAGDKVHPALKKTNAKLLEECEDNLLVKPYSSAKMEESP